jgi:coenzyme F420 hydrogenase subunit beta
MVIKPMILTLKHLFRRPVTVQYPYERLHLPEYFRGIPSIRSALCTGCARCLDVCPNNCLDFDHYKGEVAPTNRSRNVPIIYVGRCLMCGLCIEVCPTGAMTNTHHFELAEYDRLSMLWRHDRLLPLVDQDVKFDGVEVDAPLIDEDLCINCLECERVCKYDAIFHEDKGTKRKLWVDFNACTYCQKCVDICPTNALIVKRRALELDSTMPWYRDIPPKDLSLEELPPPFYRDISEEGKKHKPVNKYFYYLQKRVPLGGICCHCASCVAACPVYIIKGKDELIHIDDPNECTDCSLCVRSCPRYRFTYKFDPISGMGEYKELISAKSNRFTGQDGGMVTEIFASALEMGLIDTALVVDRDEDWKTVLKLAHNVDDIKAAAGTKYTHADILGGIRIANKASQRGFAIVGVPCETEGFEFFAKESPHLADKVRLRVALLCTESYYHRDLYGKYLKGKGIKTRDIKKINIKKGKLIVWHEKDGEVVESSWPVKESEEAVHHGCFVCHDMMGIYSDISAGGVGSDPGFTTLFVRTDVGLKILKYMRERYYIEEAPRVKMKPLEYMVEYKKKIHQFIPGSKLMENSL